MNTPQNNLSSLVRQEVLKTLHQLDLAFQKAVDANDIAERNELEEKIEEALDDYHRLLKKIK